MVVALRFLLGPLRDRLAANFQRSEFCDFTWLPGIIRTVLGEPGGFHQASIKIQVWLARRLRSLRTSWVDRHVVELPRT